MVLLQLVAWLHALVIDHRAANTPEGPREGRRNHLHRVSVCLLSLTFLSPFPLLFAWQLLHAHLCSSAALIISAVVGSVGSAPTVHTVF